MDERTQITRSSGLRRVFSTPRLDVEVRAVIEGRIHDGTYQPDQALPSEVSLANELGVSRVTLREALRVLEEEGALVRRHGVGTFVETPHPVLTCVLSVNSGVTEMVVQSGMKPGTAESQLVTHYRDPEASAALQCGPDLVALERVRTANGRRIVVTMDIWCAGLIKSLDRLEHLEGSIYDLFLENGIGITSGRALIAPSRASASLARLLGVTTGSGLLLLSQTDFDDGGRPVLVSREYWIRHAINFVVDRAARDGRGRRQRTQHSQTGDRRSRRA